MYFARTPFAMRGCFSRNSNSRFNAAASCFSRFFFRYAPSSPSSSSMLLVGCLFRASRGEACWERTYCTKSGSISTSRSLAACFNQFFSWSALVCLCSTASIRLASETRCFNLSTMSRSSCRSGISSSIDVIRTSQLEDMRQTMKARREAHLFQDSEGASEWSSSRPVPQATY